MDSISTCKNCGAALSGKFCSNCGEKVYTEKDKKIAHFFEEGFHFITHFDGKFFTTIKTIITKPGQLSLDYCNGIRKKYFKPLSLFLVIVVLYLLFPKFTGLNMRFATYLNRDFNYAWYAVPVAKNKLAAVQLTGNELADHYNAKSEKFAKPFLLILLPLTALVLWPFFSRKRKLFFDHFVLGVELNVLLIGLQFLVVPLLATISAAIYPPSDQFFADSDISIFSVLEISLMLLITVIAIKRFYAQNWWLTITKSVLFLAFYMFLIVYAYKMLLYLLIMLFL